MNGLQNKKKSIKIKTKKKKEKDLANPKKKKKIGELNKHVNIQKDNHFKSSLAKKFSE
jgi:hypothetical protein